MFTDEKYHELIVNSFEWGKYIIIYGSIFLLAILGIITWIITALSFFSLVLQSILEWWSSQGEAIALQNLQVNAILLLDLFLLSVVLFIVAIGLYGIFIKKEERIRLPIEIREISELERYLFGTIVTILLVHSMNRILNPLEAATRESIIIIVMVFAVVLVISIYLAVQSSRLRKGKVS